ncbi:MAG: phosphoenolpyruvate synthase, partial [Calothrix sp. SM1_7_51]|nr:phosphoenolpyruvate synthase [Calothrix sp. SM1_7_51]
MGTAIKKGEVLPDIYYVYRDNSSVAEKHLGNKMVAYDFVSDTQKTVPENVSQLPKILNNEFLLATLVEEAQQKQYTLSEEYLQQLIQLANQITSRIGQNFSFDWALSESNSAPRIYLTQISASRILSQNSDLIKGMGASSGRIAANACVIVNQQEN